MMILRLMSTFHWCPSIRIVYVPPNRSKVRFLCTVKDGFIRPIDCLAFGDRWFSCQANTSDPVFDQHLNASFNLLI